MGTHEDLLNRHTPFHRGGIQRLLVVIATVSGIWFLLQPKMRETTLAPRSMTTPLLQLNLNEADERELSLLPSIGPTMAKRIVENRTRFGPYESLEDLGRVPGIGEKSIEKLRIYCHVNTPIHSVTMAQTPENQLRLPQEN
jgi:competence ComEA-like helix-hairpin-helix protein